MILVPMTAFSIPSLQIVVGTCLVLGVLCRESRQVGVLLFLAFISAQAKVVLSGEQISCGCFGFHSENVSLRTLLVPVVLVALLVISQKTNQTSKEG